MDAHPTRRRRLPRLLWPTWVVLAVVVLAEVLIAVPGEPTKSSIELDGDWHTNASPAVEQAVKAKYASPELGERERVVVEQHVHGWPLPCLTRGIGRVVLRTPRAVAGAPFAGWNDKFVSGHPRTSPAWSVWLPSDGDAYERGPGSTATRHVLVPAEWEEAPLAWSDYNRWPLATDAAEWRVGPLLVNLIVLLAIAAAAAGATEWWVRRRGGLLRFRLGDLALGFVLLTVAFTWYGSHAGLRRAEQRATLNATAFLFPTTTMRDNWGRSLEGQRAFNCYRRDYQGPDWLRRLAGNDELVRLCKHVTAIELTPNAAWTENIDALPRLRRVETVSFPAGATPQALEQLRGLPRLRHVVLGVKPPDEKRPPPDGQRWVTAQDLHLLQGLPLERIDLAGESILIEDLEPLTRMPGLKMLEVIEPSVAKEQVDQLREEHPEVKIACVWCSQSFSTAFPGITHSFHQRPTFDPRRRIARVQERRRMAGAQQP